MISSLFDVWWSRRTAPRRAALAVVDVDAAYSQRYGEQAFFNRVTLSSEATGVLSPNDDGSNRRREGKARQDKARHYTQVYDDADGRSNKGISH